MSEYKKEEWRVKQPAADIRALAEQFSISPILAHIIVNREITEPDAVACYLSDDLAYTHDPALMKDMDKGCRIMKEKIRAGKKIRIISDYDVCIKGCKRQGQMSLMISHTGSWMGMG